MPTRITLLIAVLVALGTSDTARAFVRQSIDPRDGTAKIVAPVEVTRLATDPSTPGTLDASGRKSAPPRFDTRIRPLPVPAVPIAPVGITLVQPGASIERVGTIAACTPKAAALVCRAP